MLLVVLPLHSVAQLVAGLQGHRHLHTRAAPEAPSLLGQWLDRLQAGQDPRLKAPALAWRVSWGAASEAHSHGGVMHQHAPTAPDVLDVGSLGDDAGQGGATAFLAWLPAGLALPVAERGERPGTRGLTWRDRIVAPPLTPPRG